MRLQEGAYWQQGGRDDSALMGTAFPPNYQQSHRFYLDYSDAHHDIVIDEFRTTAAHPFKAAPSTRRQVIRLIHRPGTHHYGGTILFGPDGQLYISTGDVGCCGDPYDRPSSPASTSIPTTAPGGSERSSRR
jgi:glucose/arabinose dehydrogenase